MTKSLISSCSEENKNNKEFMVRTKPGLILINIESFSDKNGNEGSTRSKRSKLWIKSQHDKKH